VSRIVVRLDFGEGRSLGPGKIRLLEAIEAEGSITGAARRLGMSYRRAWLHIDALGRLFREPCVLTHPGRGRGGTSLTPFGRSVVQRYRSLEGAAATAAQLDLAALEPFLQPGNLVTPEREARDPEEA
jgi:molybdate transport system regulatory protein